MATRTFEDRLGGDDRLRGDDRYRDATPAWTGLLARLGRGLCNFAIGIVEGIEAQRRYERLAHLSDRELARRGLSRDDLPHVALFGDREPLRR